jgi:hypothetical protein
MGNALFIKARYYTKTGWALLVSFIAGIAVNFIYDLLKQTFGN